MIATRVHKHSDGEHLTFERVQDVEAILDRNKQLANDGDGYSKSRELRRVASIPLVVIEKWLNEEGINFFDPNCEAVIRRKLNSQEYQYLRTAPGRL